MQQKASLSMIISGVVGILAVACLISFLATRTGEPTDSLVGIRIHDAAVVCQFLLIIPFIAGLQRFTIHQAPMISARMAFIGIGSIVLTILLLILGMAGVCEDTLYMAPQGVLGAFFLALCLRNTGLLPKGLRNFGIVVSIGLLLVGIFPIGYAIFVDRTILNMPPVPFDDRILNTPANRTLHMILNIGSFTGVFMLPFWTLLVGRFGLKKSTATAKQHSVLA